MRDGSAMRRVAWREVWPASVLLLVSACVVAVAASDGPRASSPWLALGLLPAALFTGLAVGRSTPRTLAFLLARPCRREQLLLARFTVAMVSLGIAWTIAMAAILARDFDAARLLDGGFFAGVLVLAIVCGALGSTVTDRESLGFGIGTLVFFTVPLVPLLATEGLDMTLGRAIAAHPLALALLLAACAVGFGRAVFLAWRERLPMRDRWTARAMVTRCAAAWAMTESLCIAVVWSSASPAGATPLVVVGATERGPIVLGGSPASFDGVIGPRIDSMLVGLDPELVMLDTTRRGALLGGLPAGDVTRAVVAGGRVAVTVAARETGDCRVVVIEADGGALPIDAECGSLSLSPSGNSLAIEAEPLRVFDTTTGIARSIPSFLPQVKLLGWRDEMPVYWGRPLFSAGEMGVYFVGERAVMARYEETMRLSPDGHRVALRKGAWSRDGQALTRRDAPADIMLLSLDTGAMSELKVNLASAELVGWLDDDHVVAVGELTPADYDTLWILDANTGETVASVPLYLGLRLTNIAGPPQGPWLVGRAGAVLEAWAADGTTLWEEHPSRLELDNNEARRWTIVDGQVVGIDPRGRWWRHPVPWEVVP